MPGKKSLLGIALMSFLTTIRLAADCLSTVAVQVPPTACKSGTATAAVAAVPGATYVWTVDGGQIVGDAASDQILISLGTGAKATASVTVTAEGCVSSGIGLIVLHDPFTVNIVAIPPGRAGEPLTVLWAYANGTPAQQTISGDFGLVTLAPGVRSYTYTPQTSGSKQVVIDADMVLTTNLPPVTSRRRSVGKSPASASSCATVHFAASYTVSECMQPVVVVDAPDTVVTGTTFQIDVRPQPGAVAIWTISNGSPATAMGDTVMVTAGPSGNVGVNVQLTRGACMAQLDRSISITAAPVCENPKAAVSLGPVSCGSAIVNATFTGTPPFQGVWSDGTKFSVVVTAIPHTVTMPGNYTIVSFQDAVCAGTSSGVAVVPALLPTATVFGGGCTSVSSATVEFTGKPPFSGCWNDNTCFQTNQMEITKLLTAAGSNTLTHGTDGTNCPLTIIGAAQVLQSPHVSLTPRCEWTPTDGNGAALFVNFNGSFLYPLTVTWSDGVQTSGDRFINPSPSQTTTYTIVGVGPHNGACAVIFDPPQSFTFYPSPLPDFTLPATVCDLSTVTTSLNTPPPPGTTVTWTVQNGAIISGQGTNTIQYMVGDSPYSTGSNVICTFTFADPAHCPLTVQHSLSYLSVTDVAKLEWTGGDQVTNLKAGQTISLDFLMVNAVSWSLTDTMNDPIAQGPCQHLNGGTSCTAIYTSTHGPGQSTITLHEIGACHNQDVSIALTVIP
jgi:hypothetical protein